MKKCAIILNGNDVVKVTNLPRKINKFANNPEIKILEECDADQLDDKYNYWCKTINYNEQPQELDTVLHHYKNPKTGYTIVSIYDNIEHLKTVTKDWMDYEKLD